MVFCVIFYIICLHILFEFRLYCLIAKGISIGCCDLTSNLQHLLQVSYIKKQTSQNRDVCFRRETTKEANLSPLQKAGIGIVLLSNFG